MTVEFTDVVGDHFWLRGEAVLAVCRPSLTSGQPCRILLGGSIFLTVSRDTADRVLAQLEKESVSHGL